MDSEGNVSDTFESVVGALKENESVINFNGKTRATGTLDKGATNQESGLVANARKRAEASKK